MMPSLQQARPRLDTTRRRSGCHPSAKQAEGERDVHPAACGFPDGVGGTVCSMIEQAYSPRLPGSWRSEMVPGSASRPDDTNQRELGEAQSRPDASLERLQEILVW